MSTLSKDPVSYLYYLGRLTLAAPNLCAMERNALQIPNTSASHQFVRSFLKKSGENAAQAFCSAPCVESLKLLLEQLRIMSMVDFECNESDFQTAVSALILFTSTHYPKHQRGPGFPTGKAGRPAETDVMLITPECVIILELGHIPGRKRKDKYLWVVGDKTQHQVATEALNNLSDDEFFELSCEGGKLATLHERKELQVKEYGVEFLAKRKAKDPDNKRPLTLFAVTLVVDRFIVTEVEVCSSCESIAER
jgi:hypothetical protein